VSRLQLLSMVDRLVEAAEVWHFGLATMVRERLDGRDVA
jgi:hypothetical protein